MKQNLFFCLATLMLASSFAVSAENTKMAGFEEKTLPKESSWFCDESWTEDGKYQFESGAYIFDVDILIEWKSWSGFAISNETSTEATGNYTEQYRSAAGGAYEGENYAVCFPKENLFVSTKDGAEEIISGFYISATAWTKYAVLNGDGYSSDGGKPFGKGDYLKLTIDGYKKGEKVSTLDFYIADYRSDNEAERYIVDKWQWLDTRSLGSIDAMTFSMSGTKTNDYGLSTPAYFCLDNFNEEKNETSVSKVTADDFVVYPVPANDYITIDSACEIFAVELVSVDGRVVKAQSDALGSVSLSGLNPGVYILRLTTEEGTVVKQIIKR